MDSDERFSAFVREHTSALLKTGYLLTRDPVEAEELVQDSLVWLYPRWAQVESAEYQLAYVRKAMVNRFLAGKRRMSSTEVHFDASLEKFADTPWPGTRPPRWTSGWRCGRESAAVRAAAGRRGAPVLPRPAGRRGGPGAGLPGRHRAQPDQPVVERAARAGTSPMTGPDRNT